MTPTEYAAEIDRLAAIAPGHVLLNYLRSAQTTASELILAAEIQKAAAAKAEKTAEKSEDDPADEKLRQFRRKQASLFAERRKNSNLFHKCRTDEERATVSDCVQGIQRQIEKVMAEIQAHKIGATISNLTGDGTGDLPTDPLNLHRKILSLRSSISRKKKSVAALRGTGSPKLEKAEKDLDALIKFLEKAEAAAKDFK